MALRHIGRLIKFASFLLAVALFGCGGQPVTSSQPSVPTGPSTAIHPGLEPDRELGWLSSSSQRATLGDYRGKILVLDFYATWCVPCRESIPRLKELQQSYAASGINVVGLNVGGADDRIKVADFAKELAIDYPLGFPDKAVTDFFLSDNQTIPQTFVFDRDGVLVKRFIGYDNSTGDEIEKVVEELLAKGKGSNNREDRNQNS
jgi:thiol-disulfide isomerase/thioredoxin